MAATHVGHIFLRAPDRLPVESKDAKQPSPYRRLRGVHARQAWRRWHPACWRAPRPH